jgi:Fic family protein
MEKLIAFINKHPNGIGAKQIEQNLGFSRTTLTRKLNQLMLSEQIKKTGKGPATKYISSDKNSTIKNYFNTPHTQRPLAKYHESLLGKSPNLSKESLKQFSDLQSYQLGKQEMTKFLIDFSCASSTLEGGTYSLLDTQVLIDYGERVADKPTEDAILVLNHKHAFEYLYNNMSLDSIFEVHDLLTSDHQQEELKNSRYFLTQEFRGRVRKHTDIDIALSSYLPPFRPGTDYLDKMLAHILQTSQEITNPIRSAFYLLTRIAYLQPFQDGNKRTSRAMCNVPLIKANLPPISFVDFAKKEYILSMLAFYELGDTQLAESCFIDAYHKSIERLVVSK